MRGKPDVVLGDCNGNPWESMGCVNLAQLTPGAVIALADEVQLARLSTEGPPALLLVYGRFRTLLPVTLSTDVQAALDPLPGVSVLKTAAPGTGAWPTVEFLAAAQPQLVLWPLETSYPPSVTEYLANQVTVARIEAQGTTEVISDGRQFWVLRRSSTGPR